MTPSNKPYRIVVGVDYSEVSVLALREALRTAAERGQCELHVLHVETAVHPYPHADPQALASVGEVVARAFQRLERLVSDELAPFQEMQRQLGVKPFGCVKSHVRIAAPGREIAQLAADLEADLVVVGTQGRTGLARLLLGSVAHAVVTLAPCPVLVVRDKKMRPRPLQLDPPCPSCVTVREQSFGEELWCEQHCAHHGQRPYDQSDSLGQDSNSPLAQHGN